MLEKGTFVLSIGIPTTEQQSRYPQEPTGVGSASRKISCLGSFTKQLKNDILCGGMPFTPVDYQILSERPQELLQAL
jgi:hypothetical protein